MAHPEISIKELLAIIILATIPFYCFGLVAILLR
jgi:hypothetical protein